MDRSLSFSRAYQPNINRGQAYQNKFHIADRKVDDDVVKKMFLSIEEGNLSKLRESFNNNSSSYFVRADNGESILHAIIKSSNIDKNAKVQLVKHVIERGAQISAFDKSNVTPLHIACKLQLYDICELLLKKGADPSSLDNQYMNCLHYAVQGNLKPCEQPNDLSVKNLIPEKSKKNIGTSVIKALLNKLIVFLHKDATVNIHLKHIKNTLSSEQIYGMFEQEIDKIIKDKLDEIAKIAENMGIGEAEKKIKIITLISNCKVALHETINNNFSEITPTYPLDIAPNTPNGWGVGTDIDPARKILPFESIRDLIKKQERSSLTKLKKTISDDYLRRIKKATENITAMTSSINGLYIRLDSIFQLLTNFHVNMPRGTVYLDLTAYYQGNFANQIQRDDLDNVNLYPLVNSYKPVVQIIPRGSLEQLEIWKKDNIRPKRLELTIKDPAVQMNKYIGENPQHVGAQLNTPAHPLPNLGLPDYFIDKVNTYSKIIDENMTFIRNSSTYLDSQIDNEILLHIYDKHITYQIIKLLNICTYLHRINDSMDDVENKLTEMNNDLRNYYLIHKNNNEPLVYIVENALKQVDEMTTMCAKISGNARDVYGSIQDLYGSLERILASVGFASAINYIIAYHNIVNGIDEFENFDQGNGRSFTGYDKNFTLRKLPISLTDFPNVTTYPDINSYKKQIIENYLPQITHKNYGSYHLDATEIAKITPPHPYYYLDAGPARIQIVNPGLNIPKIGYLFDQPNFGILTLPSLTNKTGIQKNGIVYIDNPDAVTHMGTIGFKQSLPIIRTEPAFSSMRDGLAHHLFFIRARIIQYVLNELNIAPNDAIKNDVKKHVEDELKIIHSDPIIDAIIGHLTDELIIGFIERQIAKAAQTITVQIIEKTKKPFSDLVNDKVVIQRKDDGFTLHLGDIVDSLADRYLSFNNKTAALSYTLNLVMDEPKEKDDHMEQVPNDNLCISIKPEIVSLLLKHDVQINQRNVAGESPLFYAVANQHIETIQLLLENGAFSQSLTNKSGNSPLDLILKHIKNKYQLNKENSGSFSSLKIHELTKPSYKKLRDIMLQNPEYGNNILLYTENILPLLIVLLNYNLLKITNTYPRYWTLDNKQELFSLLSQTLNTSNITFLPNLLVSNMTDPIKLNNDPLEHKIKELNNQKQKIDEKIKQFDHQFKELQKEKNTQVDIHNIDNILATLQNSKKEIENRKNALESRINRLTKSSTRLNKNKTNNIDLVKLRLVEKDDVVRELKDLRNSINLNKKGPEYDLHIFQQLFDTYLKNPNNLDGLIYIHLTISRAFSEIIDLYDAKKMDKINFKKNINIIEEWYSKISGPFVRDYFQLSQDLSNKGTLTIGLENFETENYALDKTIGIITFALTSTVFTTFFYSIVKTVGGFVEELLNSDQFITKEQYAKYLETYLTNIIYNKKDDASELMTYVVQDMPRRAVKLVLNIYEGESDPDRKFTSINTLFEPILNILQNNTTLPMNADSSVIVNLKKYVFPYFKDYFELFIKEAKTVTDNYYKSILSEIKYISTLKLMLDSTN